MNINVIEAAENCRWFIEFDDKTAKGETLKVELTRGHADPKDKRALPFMAKKNGRTDKMLSSWWSVQTYTTDENGTWGERYNPTTKREAYEKIINGEPETHYRYTVDWDWWLEDTDENAKLILEEIERQAFNRSIRAALIPMNESPRLITIEQESGSFLKPLQKLVGGMIEPFDPPYGSEPLLWINDCGLVTERPNRAIYYNERMVEAGYISQIDYRAEPELGKLYAILFGDIVAVSYDIDEDGEDVARDITSEEFQRICKDFSDPTSGLAAALAVRTGLV